jgi:hypothetical protein
MTFDHIAVEARALIDTENPVHTTHHAADDATDHGAYRTCCPFAFSRTSFDAAGDALGSRYDWKCHDGNKGGNSDQSADHDSSSDVG